MLLNTFHHIPGIGEKTEKQFWSSGIISWDTFCEPYPVKLTPQKLIKIQYYLEHSWKEFEKNNPRYFADLLPSHLHWRFFPEFRGCIVYLDIETNGMDIYRGFITTIALYDGKNLSVYVKNQNLDTFKEDIQKYDIIVTYNGKCFDIPFIENHFNIRLNHAHIDLRYILSSLGYRGGLKNCESALGIDRGELNGVDGFFAVLLWNDYVINNNHKALETLLAYNCEDVVNLETLMVRAYNMKLIHTPFVDTHQISLPFLLEIPFKPDLETMERIRYDFAEKNFISHNRVDRYF